jgi:Ulp1 family protease
MDKLKPDTDLNDTIVGNYLKLLQFVFLPTEVDQKCHIFSSFFLEKLVNEYVKEDSTLDKDPIVLQEEIKLKVK